LLRLLLPPLLLVFPLEITLKRAGGVGGFGFVRLCRDRLLPQFSQLPPSTWSPFGSTKSPSLFAQRERHELLGREISQGAMRAILVVFTLPKIQEELSFSNAVEEFPI
jgi:hypothetical protein